MNTQNQTVGDIMIPLSGYPCVKESGTAQEALQKLQSFCPMGASSLFGFNKLRVVE